MDPRSAVMTAGWIRVLSGVGVFRAGLLLLLGTTLVLPGTRELHLLNTRLLLRLQGDRTFVRGRFCGGLSGVVPTVDFSETYREQCVAVSASSPDAFILAWNLDNIYAAFPPAPAWQGHPLVERAALELASRVASLSWPETRRPATQPASSSFDRYPRETIEHALELIALAQRAHPENGGLWLAEAAVRYCQEDDREAVLALRVAAAKPAWDHQRQLFFTLMRDRLLAEGLPMSDACLRARFRADCSNGAFWVMRRSRLGLVGMIAQAIQQGDHEQVSALLSLLRSLQQAHWPDNWPPNAFSRPIEQYEETGLLEAMAQAIGRSLPSTAEMSAAQHQAGESSFQARRRAEEEIFEAYLSRHVDLSLAGELIRERERDEESQLVISERRSQQNEAIMYSVIASGRAGAGGMLAFGFVLAASACELLFMLPQRRRESGDRCLCTIGFWAGLLPTLVLMTGLCFLGVDAAIEVKNTGGWMASLLPTQAQCSGLVALVFSMVWLVTRTHLLETAPPIGRTMWLAMCCLYLILLLLAAHYRHEVIAAIAASGLG